MRGYGPSLRGFLAKGGSGGGGETDEGWTYITITDDFTTLQVTPQVIVPASGPSLQFTPDPSSIYMVESDLVLTSSNGTTAPQPGVQWPLNLTGRGGGVIIAPSTSTGLVDDLNTQGVDFASRNTAVIAANNGYLHTIYAMFVTDAVITQNFALTLEAENGANVSCRAGSWMRYRKMN